MTVRYYQFGAAVGGIDANGNAIDPAAAASGGTPSSGDPETFVGTLPAGNTTVTFTREAISVDIRNIDDTDALQYSVDGGTTWITLLAYQNDDINATISNILLRPLTVANVNYEVIVILSEET